MYVSLIVTFERNILCKKIQKIQGRNDYWLTNRQNDAYSYGIYKSLTTVVLIIQ